VPVSLEGQWAVHGGMEEADLGGGGEASGGGNIHICMETVTFNILEGDVIHSAWRFILRRLWEFKPSLSLNMSNPCSSGVGWSVGGEAVHSFSMGSLISLMKLFNFKGNVFHEIGKLSNMAEALAV